MFHLDSIPDYLSFVRVTDPPGLLQEANTSDIHCYELHLKINILIITITNPLNYDNYIL